MCPTVRLGRLDCHLLDRQIVPKRVNLRNWSWQVSCRERDMSLASWLGQPRLQSPIGGGQGLCGRELRNHVLGWDSCALAWGRSALVDPAGSLTLLYAVPSNSCVSSMVPKLVSGLKESTWAYITVPTGKGHETLLYGSPQ